MMCVKDSDVSVAAMKKLCKTGDKTKQKYCIKKIL